MKESLKNMLEGHGHQTLDLGTDDEGSVDYPDYAEKLALLIKEDPLRRGILVCGSGIGMSIAVNRHPFIRAALCRSVEDAVLSRQHNDANVIIFGGRITEKEYSYDILKVFIKTSFEAGRHEKRVKKLGMVQSH